MAIYISYGLGFRLLKTGPDGAIMSNQALGIVVLINYR